MSNLSTDKKDTQEIWSFASQGSGSSTMTTTMRGPSRTIQNANELNYQNLEEKKIQPAMVHHHD